MQDDTAEENVIQMKRCPRCRTSIRLSLRYGNIIKQQLRDIEKVKMIMRQKTDQGLSAKLTQLRVRVKLLSAGGRKDYLNVWEQLFTKVTNGLVAAKLENRILLMGRISSLTKRIRENLDLPEDVYRENNFDGKYHYSTLTKCCYSFFLFVAILFSVCQPNSVILQLLWEGSQLFPASPAPWVDPVLSPDCTRFI